MKQGLSKATTLASVVRAYSFLFKNFLYVFRLVFPFMFVYLSLDMLIKTGNLLSRPDSVLYIKNFLMDFFLGCVLFGVSRRMILEEDVFKMKWGEIFDNRRMNALFFGAFIFAVLQTTVGYCENTASRMLIGQGFDKSNLIAVLLFGYAALLLFIASFIAIAIAVGARGLSYLYSAFRPRFMWIMAGVWTLTALPLFVLYYMLTFFIVYGGRFDVNALLKIMEQPFLVDKVLFGLVKVIAFILFVAGISYTTKFFLIFKSSLPVANSESSLNQKDAPQSKT